MNSTIKISAIAAVLCHLASGTRAEGLVPQLSVGQMAYSIETAANQVWKGSGRAATVGLDYALPSGYFVGLGHTASLSGDLEFSFEGEAFPTRDPFKRRDTYLTAGLSEVDHFNYFLGLRSATSTIDSGVGTKFETSGYFVGASLPVAVGSGYLSFSAAIGLNKASWEDVSGVLKDSAVGYSGGIRYSYAIGNSVVMGIGFKAQTYEYLFGDSAIPGLTEKLRLFDVSCSFAF